MESYVIKAMYYMNGSAEIVKMCTSNEGAPKMMTKTMHDFDERSKARPCLGQLPKSQKSSIHYGLVPDMILSLKR